jgi:predicted RNA-binding Zn-ribbon protein involved in translation (DUF1610 family)
MFDNLYVDIGSKIKGMAKWTFIVEAIGLIITGIALAIEQDFPYILVAIIGPIVAWVSSWILYAFGELVEDVHALRDKIPPIYKPIVKNDTEQKQPQTKINPNVTNKETPTFQKSIEINSNCAEVPQQNVSQKEAEAKKEEALGALPCPECGEDLSFMGWDENELNQKQSCPLCGKEILFNQ